MTKNELAAQLAEQKGLNKSTAIKSVEGLMEIMADAFVRKEDIFLRGFGTFKIIKRKGKTGRDISRGEPITIPAHHAVVFIPCETLKKKVK